jgi:hypothetical protein
MGIMESTLGREVLQKIQTFRDVKVHHWGNVSLHFTEM